MEVLGQSFLFSFLETDGKGRTPLELLFAHRDKDLILEYLELTGIPPTPSEMEFLKNHGWKSTGEINMEENDELLEENSEEKDEIEMEEPKEQEIGESFGNSESSDIIEQKEENLAKEEEYVEEKITNERRRSSMEKI